MQRQNRILTAMADAVLADLGEERRLRIDKESPFAKALDSIRLPERDKWFKSYLCGRLSVLLASIVDSAYRLDLVLAAPSPAGVSVVEYHILRPMLEYTYKLLNLVQVEIEVRDREQRAIEDWYSDYQQFRRIPPTFQHMELEQYFTKWRPILTQWYKELTDNSKIRDVKILDIFNQVGMPDSGWPQNRWREIREPRLPVRIFSLLSYRTRKSLGRPSLRNESFSRHSAHKKRIGLYVVAPNPRCRG